MRCRGRQQGGQHGQGSSFREDGAAVCNVADWGLPQAQHLPQPQVKACMGSRSAQAPGTAGLYRGSPVLAPSAAPQQALCCAEHGGPAAPVLPRCQRAAATKTIASGATSRLHPASQVTLLCGPLLHSGPQVLADGRHCRSRTPAPTTTHHPAPRFPHAANSSHPLDISTSQRPREERPDPCADLPQLPERLHLQAAWPPHRVPVVQLVGLLHSLAHANNKNYARGGAWYTACMAEGGVRGSACAAVAACAPPPPRPALCRTFLPVTATLSALITTT